MRMLVDMKDDATWQMQRRRVKRLWLTFAIFNFPSELDVWHGFIRVQ